MASTVRVATPADVPSLEVIRRQAIEASFADHFPRAAYADLVVSADPALPSRVGDSGYHVLVSETTVTPVGYAVARREDGELLEIYTAPGYRRRGYASALLDVIEGRLHVDGRDSIAVWTAAPARPFFLARGYWPTGDRTDGAIARTRLRKCLEADGEAGV